MDFSDTNTPVNSDGKVLKLKYYPDDILKTKSQLILDSIPENTPLQSLLNDMVATVKHYRAIGLSAVQVGVPVAAFVMQDLDGQIYKVINPNIKSIEGWSFENEGCLSMPGCFTRIRRPAKVQVTYFDETGKPVQNTFEGLMARCFVHETEHTLGQFFLDKMPTLQKDTQLKKYNKLRKKLGF